MSSYLNVYLKDTRDNSYSKLYSYCGHIRNSFNNVMGDNSTSLVIYGEKIDVAKQLTKKDIDRIVKDIYSYIEYYKNKIKQSELNIERILKMSNDLCDKLEAMQDEQEAINSYNKEIECYIDARYFYTYLYDIEDSDNRIFAGIECYAPDGSDYVETNLELSLLS